MSDKPNYEVFTTPVGELVYPWLTKADTRWSPDGQYKTKLRMPFEQAQEFIAQLEKVLHDFIATLDMPKQKTYEPVPVYEAVLDEETGEETGLVEFKFKLNRIVTPKNGEPFEQKVVCVFNDDGGTPVDKPIYGGTMACIKGQIAPYTNAVNKSVGLTLRPRAVQVHELVTGAGGSGFWTQFGDAGE